MGKLLQVPLGLLLQHEHNVGLRNLLLALSEPAKLGTDCMTLTRDTGVDSASPMADSC